MAQLTNNFNASFLDERVYLELNLPLEKSQKIPDFEAIFTCVMDMISV